MLPQPSQTQQRGYLWLTLILIAVSAVLLIVVKCGGSHEEDPQVVEQFQQHVDSFGNAIEESLQQEQQQRAQRYRQGRREGSYIEHNASTSANEIFPPASQRATRRLTFELNSADTTDLQQLYGIGPTFARRIVQYRQRLGGYISLTQLLEVYGITPERYAQIAPQLTLDTTQRTRIQVNSASIDQLKRHPYLDYYQAKAIVNYRKSGNTYHSLDDLANVNTITDSTLQKIAPYISFE